MIRPAPAPDGSTTERLVDQLRARHAAGLAKYGVTVDRTDLDPLQWIQHLREELLDGLAYLQRIDDEFQAVVEMKRLAEQVLDDIEAARARHAAASKDPACNQPPEP